jgi:hypothetical protein
MSIDEALFSGSKCYFFAGSQYIQVTRGDTGPGTVDPGYPAPIANWGDRAPGWRTQAIVRPSLDDF